MLRYVVVDLTFGSVDGQVGAEPVAVTEKRPQLRKILVFKLKFNHYYA